MHTHESDTNRIYQYLENTGTLFWEIDLIKNKIHLLNDVQIPGLGSNTGLLLKNPGFSREVILPEDYPCFESFHKGMKTGKKASIVFRVKSDSGIVRWLSLTGYPDISNNSVYTGILRDITDITSQVRAIDKENSGLETKIEIFDIPVILIDFAGKLIKKVNRKACDEFGFTKDELTTMHIDDLFGNNDFDYLQSIYESLIFYQRWDGAINYADSRGQLLAGDTKIRSISSRGENFLWIAVNRLRKIDSRTAAAAEVREISEAADCSDPLNSELKALASQTEDIREFLNLVLKKKLNEEQIDSLMFSDIMLRENQVKVYAAGPPFDSLEDGRTFPYEGTIAENIVKYNLSHLIVDDTFESIKPIDWALFIPYGISSYYAVPFYVEGNLDTVIIFCSSEKDRFSRINLDLLDELCPCIIHAVETWRKKHNQ